MSHQTIYYNLIMMPRGELKRELVACLRPQARWLALGAAWQLGSGLSNVVLDWPLLAAVAHTGGAAGLVVVFTGALLSLRGQTQAQHHVSISSTTGRPA